MELAAKLKTQAPDRDSADRQISIEPLAPACGAEVSGIDLAVLDEPGFEEVHRAFLRHHVLFFRDQRLTPESQKALGRRFGSLNIHPQYMPLDGDPEIFPVVKEPQDKENIGEVWHSDITFLERPAMAALLYGIEVPPVGGDTLFSNLHLAYEGLSEGMKRLLSGLKAWHSDRLLSDPVSARLRNANRSTKIAVEAMGKAPIETLHPVVRTHPETGRKGLFVNRAFTTSFEGMTEAESRPLLEFLWQEASRPEYTCRFRWTAGTLALWDNRCLMHFALNDYPGHRRYMHRVTVNGDRPV